MAQLRCIMTREMSQIRKIGKIGAVVLLHPAAPVLVALGLHLWRLGHASLWADEGATFGIAQHGLVPYEHPAAYFRFMSIWIKLLGVSEITLRLPSACCMAAFVFIVYRAASEMGGRHAGAWAAWFAALSPFVRLGAQEARMYAPLALFQGLAFLGVLESLAGKRRGLVLWGIGTVLSVSLHHLGWIACWPLFLLLLFRSPRKPVLVTGAITMLACIPLFLSLLRQLSCRLQGNHLGTTPGFLAAVKKIAGQVYYMGAGYLFTRLDASSITDLLRWPTILLVLLQVVLPLVILLWGVTQIVGADRRHVLLLGLFFLPTFLFLAYEGSPANLLLPIYGAYVIILGIGAAKLPRWIPLSLAALWIVTVTAQSGQSSYAIHPEDWRALSGAVSATARPGDAIYLTGSRNSHFITDFYPVAPAVRYSAVDSMLLVSTYDAHRPPKSRSIVRSVKRLFRAHERVWFVYIDYDMPFMEQTVDSLWRQAGVERRQYGAGLELLLLETRDW